MAAAAQIIPVASNRELLRTPVGFSRMVLGHEPWKVQRDILDSVASCRRIAVKSCHSSGKTFLSADAVLWWITTFPDAIAVTTAPTWLQVDQLLWGEIRQSVSRARIKYPKMASTELKLGEKNYAIGISTNESARFQGFHSNKVLIVMDEAPGVNAEVWRAIQGLRAGGDVRLLAIGNPVIVGGEFNDAFTTKRSMWRTHTISAFDTPNLAGLSLTFTGEDGNPVRIGDGPDLTELTEEQLDQNVQPYLCTRRWVLEMFQEWGPTHAYFESRVLGEFPRQGDDTLIPLSWLERGRLSEPKAEDAKARIRVGLDVAGPGEAETVMACLKGSRVLMLKAWPNADPRGEVVAALGPWKTEIEALNVDCVGIGWGMYTHLKDIFGPVVHPVNVGEAARNKEKFANAKAEHYWGLRMRAQAGDLRGLDDEKTIGQLTAIRYSHNARGQIAIEGKDEMRKRGVRSPDRAEALMLACAQERRPQLFPLSTAGLVQPSAYRMDSVVGASGYNDDEIVDERGRRIKFSDWENRN